jgi:hypothetical protein
MVARPLEGFVRSVEILSQFIRAIKARTAAHDSATFKVS